MSGHSHWAGIKHKKGIEDAKRAKIFAKLARVIVIAAREKGANLDMNPGLRVAVEKARAANMPSDNIDRAIKHGTGEGSTEALEGFLYEVFGPGGAAVLIEGITDNKNRTWNEIRKMVSDHGGRMADPGSVQWMFERKGYLAVTVDRPQLTVDMEGIELKIIDAGADDIESRADGIVAYTAPDKLMEAKKNLEAASFRVLETGFEYLSKNPIPVTDEKTRGSLEKFFEALDDHDDVQEIYSNI